MIDDPRDDECAAAQQHQNKHDRKPAKRERERRSSHDRRQAHAGEKRESPWKRNLHTKEFTTAGIFPPTHHGYETHHAEHGGDRRNRQQDWSRNWSLSARE